MKKVNSNLNQNSPIVPEGTGIVDAVKPVGGTHTLSCIKAHRARPVGHPAREVEMLETTEMLNRAGQWKEAHRVELLRLHQFENSHGDHPFETMNSLMTWALQAGEYRTAVSYQTGTVFNNYVEYETHAYQRDLDLFQNEVAVDEYYRHCYDAMMIDIDDIRGFLLANTLLGANVLEDVRDGMTTLKVKDLYPILMALSSEPEVYNSLCLQWRGFDKPSELRWDEAEVREWEIEDRLASYDELYS